MEQKNGAVVRQVVGYDRLEGERAYRQLAEVYQALRLYVNGFQPSMKLQATQYDGRKIQRVYDAAETPLQRLLLSHVLPPSKEQELQRAGACWTRSRLFQHLQDLQQALLSPTTSASANAQGTACGVVLPVCLDRCLAKSGPAEASTMEESRQKRLTHANTLARVFPEQSDRLQIALPHPLARVMASLELTRKNGVSKVGVSFPYNGIASSKATGLTSSRRMCHRLCDLAQDTFDASLVLFIPGVDTLAARTPPCERRVSTWTLCGGRLAPTSEREIYLRACHARSSRLPSLPQANRSYVPFAPSCLNSLTPDAHRAGPLHPIVGSAEVARCPSFPASTFG